MRPPAADAKKDTVDPRLPAAAGATPSDPLSLLQPMRASVVAALIVGALLRIAILPLGVAAVDDSWRAWSYQGARRGPWNLYGPKGHTVRFGDIDAPVVYPPLALDELAIPLRVMTASGTMT